LIHRFKQGGDCFIIDPPSGAVHSADEDAYELIGEINELYKKGLLFSGDNYAKYAEAPALPKALCLNVSHDCNLACEYCFAAGSSGTDAIYGGERGVMPPETAIKAVDFLVRNSGDRPELEADFFGGEPLMAWETVTAAVDYARSKEAEWGKRFRFTVTTNGILLDGEKTDYINREMSNCVLSLDGREAVNDLMRGKGVYAEVLPKFRKLVRARLENNKPGFTDYYIRGTYTAYNLDFADDFAELARLGFKNISLEPVTAPVISDKSLPFAIKKEHIGRICNEYDRLFDIIKSGKCGGANFFHFNAALDGGPCIIRRLRGCGCGGEYAAVSPDGGVYPCHRFIGDPKWLMGNVNTGDTLNPEIRGYFTKTHIYSKTRCRDCWARFYCSGGCNALSYANYGDVRITDPDSVECTLMKKRLECAIALNTA